jgi:hypothetical protein
MSWGGIVTQMFDISLLPLGEGPGNREVPEAARCSSPLPNPLPKGEGVRTTY